MLAAAPKDIPLREQSHLTIQSSRTDQVPLEDRLCPGCKKSAVNEQGGLVVAFGQSFFHVDCFKCAKCRNQVTADTNLLLLSDGSPICANCSYSCNVCRLPILDEAIMTGDDSYHAHCFKCKVCSNRIDELVFAKTSQGIYCMNCHNERMIKIRKHAQKKAERERQANGGSGSSRSRETEARNFHRDQESRSAYQKPLNASASYRRDEPHFSDSSKYNHDVPVPSLSPPVAVILPLEPDQQPTDERPPPAKSNTLPTPLSSIPSDKTRRGSDAPRSSTIPIQPDTRPSDPGNIAVGNSTLSPQSLSVTSRHDKRRSINPGLTLSLLKDGPAIQNANHSPVHSTLQSHSPPSPFLTATDHFAASNKRSRSNSATSSHSQISQLRDDETVVMASPSNVTTDLETSTKSPRYGSQHSTLSRTSGSLSPIDAQYPTNRSSFASGSIPSRAASPAHRVDVPQGVDSDTDVENDTDYRSDNTSGQLPPALPPKNLKPSISTPPLISAQSSVESDTSFLTIGDADDTGVEQTSHTTFIAPALPPIRFSMNNADFSELLGSVAGLSLQKSLDGRKKPTKESQGGAPSTPPPTATSASMPTPRGRDSSARESVSSTSSGREVQTNPVLSFTPPPDDTASEINVSLEQSNETNKTRSMRQLESESVLGQLREAINSAKERGARQLQVDINFVDAVIDLIESRDASFNQMKARVDGMNRESKRFIAGLTVAQAEYDQELKARRDAEAEVTRLRVLLSGQAVRLAALSGDNRKQELRQQLSKELHDNLSGLEQDLSRLKVERDVTLAEFEELSAKAASGVPSDITPASLSRSLTKRLESIRSQYQSELIPLTEQKEALCREIAELKSVRDMFLEETTVLNARNEELAQLSAVYARRIEVGSDILSKTVPDITPRPSADMSRGHQQTGLIIPSLSSSTSGSSTVYDDSSESRHMRTMTSQLEFSTPMKGKFKWPGSKPKETASPMSHSEHVRKIPNVEHNFQQLSVLRFARCDHCGDKMWGSQLRCTACATSIHVRCIAHVQLPCTQNHRTHKDEPELLSPSMFGRHLTEQVRADSKDIEHQVPVLVEKCIQAVEARALDYEGIYRKTGGSSQSKAITQLFERGDYDSFDLCDADRFTDVCSITSVLKTYFRSLPIPLLTFDLHDQFVQAVTIRDPVIKERSLTELINSLPNEHYCTLRMLMTHLNHVSLRCDLNLMTSRNLGVVFGPTLMRSRDPGAEFSDMAGKALFVEWLVENAPLVFQTLDG